MLGRSYLRDLFSLDRVICAARRRWYGMTEPEKLSIARVMALTDRPTKSDLISVIVPTFNRCDLLLSRALPRIINQTHRNIEVIIAAHGCTDDTKERVRLWVRNQDRGDKRVKVIEVPRRRTYPPTAENHWLAGPVAPINAALKVCRGKWIARCDDDDEWTLNHLKMALEFAIDGDYEFVSSAHEAAGEWVNPYMLGETPIGGVQTWLYRSYLKGFKVNPDCWRKTWDRVNDTDLQARFWAAGVRMGYQDRVTVHIQPRPGDSEIGLRAYKANEAEVEAKMAF